jgi:hypothetical protein
MSYEVYNPYRKLGTQFKDGMDYIIENIIPPEELEAESEPITFDQLNDTLLAYFQSLIVPETESVSVDPTPSYAAFTQNMVLSILPNAANSYQNSNLGNESFYNPQQVVLMNSIYVSIKGNDVEGMLSVLNDANREIAESGLSAVDQTPLFVAVEIGKRSYEYWMENIYDEESDWLDYLNASSAINTANLPYWVTTSMEGALSGFAQVQQLNMGVATSLNTAGRTIALMAGMLGAVGLSSGKMFFKWTRRLNIKDLGISSFTTMLIGENKINTTGRGPTPAGTIYTGITACCNPPTPKDTTTAPAPKDTIN